ncbi:MAG: hypothetical protein R3E94_03710 [Burkholderiaceae bacterium]
MSDIHATAAGKFPEITTLIDGIAFQTNILALNAAVALRVPVSRDAALPSWPQRSATWLQRSAGGRQGHQGLIEDSGQKVHDGSALVEKAGSNHGSIVGSVRKMSEPIGEIASATREQG